jgi:glutamine synthetase
MSEYAPGQFEITLHHRADALRRVDEAVMFKRVLRGVAQKHGPDRLLHGQAVHGARRQRTARACESQRCRRQESLRQRRPAGTDSLRQAIGGMKDSMAESMAVFAPNANSYRRFVSESYAPVAPIWGINNRSVSLRVPAGRRYLGTWSIASAVPMPICISPWPRCWAPPRMDCENAWIPAPRGRQRLRPAGVRTLPSSWSEALALAEKSEFLEETLGKEFLKDLSRHQEAGMRALLGRSQRTRLRLVPA